MFEKNLATVVGALILGMGISGAAEAITLKKVDFDYGGTNSDPIGWQSLGWEARGRAGRTTEYQFAVRPDGRDAAVATANWNWISGQQVDWSLLWDQSKNKMTFNIGNKSLKYKQDIPAVGSFTNFSLETLVNTSPFGRNGQNKVGTSTTMELAVNTVNGVQVNPLLVNSKASGAQPNDAPLIDSNKDIDKYYFISDTPISSMSGFVKMSWLSPDLNPRTQRAGERVTFKIEGGTGIPFPLEDSIQPVPEPAPTFGFLAVGAILAGTALKKNRSN
jgi:hypothetical protein